MCPLSVLLGNWGGGEKGTTNDWASLSAQEEDAVGPQDTELEL